MRCTTLQDTAFERADNFLSNECIHTRFPFQVVSSQAANKYASGFCVFRFQNDSDERQHFVLSSLYRNITLIWPVNCAQKILVLPEPPSPCHHLSLCSKQSPRLAMYASRSFKTACIVYSLSHPALGDVGPAEPQTLLQMVEILDLYTAVHQPLQLPLVPGAS